MWMQRAAEQRLVDLDLELDRGAREPAERLGRARPLGLVDRRRGADPGDAPATGPGGLLDQPVQGAHESRARPPVTA